MDQKLFEMISTKYGYAGILLMWLAYIFLKYGFVMWKKHTGSFISYEALSLNIKALEDKMSAHTIESNGIKSDLEVLKKTQPLINSHVQEKLGDVQRSLNEIQTFLIQQNNK